MVFLCSLRLHGLSIFSFKNQNYGYQSRWQCCHYFLMWLVNYNIKEKYKKLMYICTCMLRQPVDGQTVTHYWADTQRGSLQKLSFQIRKKSPYPRTCETTLSTPGFEPAACLIIGAKFGCLNHNSNIQIIQCTVENGKQIGLYKCDFIACTPRCRLTSKLTNL